jgi:hypothetical protein
MKPFRSFCSPLYVDVSDFPKVMLPVLRRMVMGRFGPQALLVLAGRLGLCMEEEAVQWDVDQ